MSFSVDESSWLQVDLLRDYMVHGVITQGIHEARSGMDDGVNFYVSTFKILYKKDADAKLSTVQAAGSDKVITLTRDSAPNDQPTL